MKPVMLFTSFLLLTIFTTSCTDSSSLSSEIIRKNGMVLIPSGTLNMGGDNAQADANELPKHKVPISSFWMDETEVTNEQFSAFVKATSYKTVAERDIDWDKMKLDLPPNTLKPHDSLLLAGALVFHATEQPVPFDNPGRWWRWTTGADWQHPEGPESDIKNKMNHPVVQVAWEDANAYAKWAKKRLPTEAEWEWASRGGKVDAIYPWGNEPIEQTTKKANFWQGLFPFQNKETDGFYTTSPAKSYPPNDYGLYDMAGNVWEWCADWLDVDYYKKSNATMANTKGPTKAYNPSAPFLQEKVVRGGSFLCNDDYCSGYLNSRRMGSSIDTGLNHTGFRCAMDVKGGD